MRVNYGQTVHGEEEIAAVVEVLRSSTQMGRNVAAMEARVAVLFGKRFGIMVNSGSSALEIAIRVMALDPGDEVITPALTFATTVAPSIRAGLVPVFVDVEPDTFNIDVAQVERMVGPATKALVIPNLIGNAPDWDELRKIADRHGLLVLEDSADTLGATLRGTPTGVRADISTTSFYGSHVINGGGNGGMLCMSDESWARTAKLLRSWGRSSSLFQNQESERIEHRFDISLDGIDYDRKFVFEALGYNLEPSEMSAAFGLVQLGKLDHNITARRHWFECHMAFFKAYQEFFILPRECDGLYTGWLAFPVIIRPDAPFVRKAFQMYLEQADVQTRPVFTGNILRQPAMRGVPVRTVTEGYPNADRVMRGGVLLACHHGLDAAQIDYMHDRIAGFIAGLPARETWRRSA
jgi:CDP-6-deoxy-D-xylo-4-hexulose-3-dehydrase